ncbi:MAG: Carbohydrate-binding family 9, partial [Paenibacillus sp.]|nr:Carbohydrate-binding family 9 [Paenibacillus sp.]
MMSSIYRGTMAVILIASLIGTLWAIVPAERAYAANLVANPGFESGLWADRNSTNFSIDGVVRHSGSSSLKVEGSTAGQHMISEPIPIHAFEGYRLKAWIRSDLAGSQSSLSIGLLPVTAANQPLPWYPGGQSTLVDAGGGRQGWTQYSATIRDLPAAAVAVKIYLRIGAGASGSAWFDDISFESANLAPVGGFETGLWSVNNGFVQDVGESHGGSSSASAVGQTAGRSLQSGLVPIKEKERYTLTAWVKTDQVSSSDGAAVSVLQVDGSNQSLGWFGGSVKLLTAGGTNGWIKLEAELSDFAQGTENVRLYLRLDGGVTGTVWFDDVRLMQRYRDGFMWGVNAHGKSAGDYPASQLGNQMQKGADLGISHYRINVNPDIISGNYDWTYLDQVVDTAYNKGLKLFLVLYSSL